MGSSSTSLTGVSGAPPFPSPLPRLPSASSTQTSWPSDLPEFPASLGLRPQVLKLRYVSPATEGRFIAPALSADRAVAGVGAPPPGAFYREFIGETVSLIHAPLLLQGEILTDAILGRQVAS